MELELANELVSYLKKSLPELAEVNGLKDLARDLAI